MHRFKKLEMWQRSREFCSEIYTITNLFPDNEKFGLTNQLRRAPVSIPSNIAEGSSRTSNKDFSRFLEIAIDLNFLVTDKFSILIDKLEVITKMMTSFRNNLKN